MDQWGVWISGLNYELYNMDHLSLVTKAIVVGQWALVSVMCDVQVSVNSHHGINGLRINGLRNINYYEL